jgi:O-antigen/teichoic acid export membrane protein
VNQLFKIDKDILILFLGRAFQAFVSLVALKVITTFLSKEEVGNYYIALSFIFFFTYIFLNPIAMYLSRHILLWRSQKKLINMLGIFSLYIFIWAIISIVVVFFSYELLDLRGNFKFEELLILIALSIFISTLNRNILSSINILGYRVKFVFLTIATLALGLFLSLFLVIFFETKATSWFYGVLIAESLILYFGINFILNITHSKFKNFILNIRSLNIDKIFSFCAPIFLTNIFLWSQLYLYRLIVDFKYNAVILGDIGVALSVSAAIFALVESIVVQYFYPIFLKDLQGADEIKRSLIWNLMAKNILPVYVFVAIFVLTMSQKLLIVLTGKEFHHVYIITCIGVSIEFFRVVTNLFNQFLQAQYKTSLAIMPYLIGTIFIIFGLIFINLEDKYYYIALILGIGNFITFLCIYIKINNICNIDFELNYKKIMLFSLAFFFIYGIGTIATSFIQHFILLVIATLYLGFTIYIYNKEAAI